MKLFLLLLLLLSVPVSYAAKKRNKNGDEFAGMAREIRVNRRVEEHLEEEQRLIDYAVKHQQFTPEERRKIMASKERIERLSRKAKESGKMSVQEERTINREISRVYRMIWFYRYNGQGKTQKLVFLGRQVILREPYLEKAKKGSLDQKTMQKILSSVYRAHRICEQLKETNLSQPQRKQLERECFIVLAEYFQMAE